MMDIMVILFYILVIGLLGYLFCVLFKGDQL